MTIKITNCLGESYVIMRDNSGATMGIQKCFQLRCAALRRPSLKGCACIDDAHIQTYIHYLHTLVLRPLIKLHLHLISSLRVVQNSTAINTSENRNGKYLFDAAVLQPEGLKR
ncbi:unnamed protein product [Ceratitis capitata]|uniref:(Mediterranean fruit fly) hypothetical protein n=1 Tax=Ceratitis capitata TaxID=7213 RepID=A0A811U2B9_CERCA|nr:unnamed protein product [Ceratitis capitata]